MAYQQAEHSSNIEVFEPLIDKGLAGLPEVMSIVLNQAMEVERCRYLQAEPYEQTEERKSYANGYKPKQLRTRVGKLSLSVPQTRDCAFYPSCLEQGMRSERALKLTIAEMYFQGVSTRKVKEVMSKLCGLEVTSTEVSNAVQKLGEEFEQWRNRKIGKYRYVYLDACYESIREAGNAQNNAVLIAVGIDDHGKRDILGLSVALSEHEVHWREFLTRLQERGLQGIELFISDDHAGLKAARKALFPSIPWQRCHFHLQQNAQAYMTKQSRRREVGTRIRAILTAPTQEEAEQLLKETVKRYEKDMPRLANWMEKNIPEGFTHFRFPEAHHRKIRTSNLLERLNREIRRRTRVIGVFPNVASCERLISAILIEIHEEWQTEKKYLIF